MGMGGGGCPAYCLVLKRFGLVQRFFSLFRGLGVPKKVGAGGGPDSLDSPAPCPCMFMLLVRCDNSTNAIMLIM